MPHNCSCGGRYVTVDKSRKTIWFKCDKCKRTVKQGRRQAKVIN